MLRVAAKQSTRFCTRRQGCQVELQSNNPCSSFLTPRRNCLSSRIVVTPSKHQHGLNRSFKFNASKNGRKLNTGLFYSSVSFGLFTLCCMTGMPVSTRCELQTNAGMVQEMTKLETEAQEIVLAHDTIGAKVKHILKMIRRVIKLMVVLSPLALVYPLQYLLPSPNDDSGDGAAQDIVLATLKEKDLSNNPLGWYYKLCLFCIEYSGAATIKIMQWAGSRPDMFGPTFCSVFSQLQDDTTPHKWKYTEKVLEDAFGENWREKIELHDILGSGCIAQVYKGVVTDSESGEKKEVAVKVMHPHVDDDIDTDLDIMRMTLRLVEKMPFNLLKGMRWLNIEGFIDEMDKMLKIQLDLRNEADHIAQFNKNFEDDPRIIFPKLVNGFEPTKEVLVESFCEGKPILQFIRENSHNRELLSAMCFDAIGAVCKMMFLDNFCHGDLHPGNVLITPDEKFVLLDLGIVTEHSERDHLLISEVLASFVRCEGRKAGRIMIEDSNSRLRGTGEHALEEELFIDKIEQLTIAAKRKGYLMENLGTYISYICNSAAQHHVMLNQSFIASALTVKVQEGIALAMDPSIEIWRVAIPVILEAERKNMTAERASKMLGVDKLYDWIVGGK